MRYECLLTAEFEKLLAAPNTGAAIFETVHCTPQPASNWDAAYRTFNQLMGES